MYKIFVVLAVASCFIVSCSSYNDRLATHALSVNMQQKEITQPLVVNYFPSSISLLFKDVYYTPSDNYIQVFDQHNTQVSLGDTSTKENVLTVAAHVQETGVYIVYYRVTCGELCQGAFTFSVVNPYAAIPYAVVSSVLLLCVCCFAYGLSRLVFRRRMRK